mgnify:CR=1 FL=1
MKVLPLLQARPAEPRTLPPLPQGGGGFAALLSPQGKGPAGESAGGAELPGPAAGISGDLAELLTGLRAAMAEDLETLPELSPAGLERVEQAMAGRIAESLAAFDAERGTGMLDSLGADTAQDLAAHLFRTMTADRANAGARTPARSLETAIAQLASALGIEAPAAPRPPAPPRAPARPSAHRRQDRASPASR